MHAIAKRLVIGWRYGFIPGFHHAWHGTGALDGQQFQFLGKQLDKGAFADGQGRHHDHVLGLQQVNEGLIDGLIGRYVLQAGGTGFHGATRIFQGMCVSGDLKAVLGRFSNHGLLEFPPVSVPKQRTDHAAAAVVQRGLDQVGASRHRRLNMGNPRLR